jgi:hypothetical protein
MAHLYAILHVIVCTVHTVRMYVPNSAPLQQLHIPWHVPLRLLCKVVVPELLPPSALALIFIGNPFTPLLQAH